jgi:osmotically-inducible protein OsmY
MKSDPEIREDVVRELQWDVQVPDSDSIGVAVKDGAVTLTGHTPTYAQKLAVVSAAERVYGVKAVADEVTVHLSGDPRDDGDIARTIAHVLESNTQIPESKVQAEVENGWVTLNGDVDYSYQRYEVERMTRNVRGVKGITNLVRIVPPPSGDQVETEIQQAFRRDAELDARRITVQVSEHTARLYGHVHSIREANAASAAAAAAPGIAKVENHLLISP